MRLVELLENLCLDKSQLRDNDYYLVSKSYTQAQWIEVTQTFLSGLDRLHRVPYQTWITLNGICHHYHEHKEITHRQQLYLVFNVIDHWHQMSCVARAQLSI